MELLPFISELSDNNGNILITQVILHDNGVVTVFRNYYGYSGKEQCSGFLSYVSGITASIIGIHVTSVNGVTVILNVRKGSGFS